jgi:enamine deaminase RidA (YjgF/YER057c/UK114 family)
MTDASPRRRQVFSGGAYEMRFGYCRALRTGDRILVSGCTSAVDGKVSHPGDPEAQMRVALDTAVAALTALGGSVGDVVRTRTYVVNRLDCELVGAVHGERFSRVCPTATLVLVAGLVDDAMLVEIELEARVGTADPPDGRGPRSVDGSTE